jgi:hypothetical protein
VGTPHPARHRHEQVAGLCRCVHGNTSDPFVVATS